MDKRRLVIKVGTSTLLDEHERPSGTFQTVADSIASIIDHYDVVLVTSGAIGFGVRKLGLDDRPEEIEKLQALASIGQVSLMQRWDDAFSEHAIGQILLTSRELEDPENMLPLSETLQELWRCSIIPIVNENDAIANEEISFGDNDRLAALVAAGIGADTLILLTDQDGIQENYGRSNQRRLPSIDVSDAGIHVVKVDSLHSRGGMTSKLLAASIAKRHGITTYIAHARKNDVIQETLAGKTGTKLV